MITTHSWLILALSVCCLPLFGQKPLWHQTEESSLSSRSEKRWIIPAKYKTFELDMTGMEMFLADSPLRYNENRATKTIELPTPDGSFQHFAITEAPVMDPRLASKFPTIHCYAGQGIDDPSASVYLDITPQGFHGMVIKSGQAFYIDPYFADEQNDYVVYNKDDFYRENADMFNCLNDDGSQELETHANILFGNNERVTSVSMRTYTIAVAAAGEYTQYHGGTVAAGLAAIVTALNRVRGIYETELAITFELVANNDLIIYTNPATDPYSSTPTHVQNQANLDAVIGNSNYDIGHVLGVGTGGIARVSSTCSTTRKAYGMTSLQTPKGDPFYVDFFCHEIGHQLGANHTFNGNGSSCGTAGTKIQSAYEPGSGSTIMSYAGTCGSQNLQLNGHAYFHRRSLDEITTFVTTGLGNTCATLTSTTNNVPTIEADPYIMNGKYIPISTPFELTASGSDDDALTYAWEQMDLGASGPPSSSAPGPIIRSYPPTSSPTRTIPTLNALLENTTNYGEFLPSITRTLKFKATARDNRSDGGGNAADSIMLNVTNTAGPFNISNLNTSAVVSGAILVQWNVANTNNAPINCSNVDIFLSVDGGQTFSPLVTNSPNDGNEVVTLPNTATGQARIKVKCSDNVFFDINNADLRIAPSDANCSEKVTSGNFSSATGWSQYSTNFGYVIDNWGVYHRADGAAWLGYADDETSYISQNITIPATAHFANLEFWYKIEAADCGSDIFKVYVNGAVAKTYTLCNDPAAGHWTRQLINLSGQIGSTFQIKFELVNNSTVPSDLLIDDVSVYTCENGAFITLPIELMKFDAIAVETTANLHWVTASETNNKGFNVEMQTEDGEFQTVGFVKGQGTTLEQSSYNFEIPNLKPNIYYFRLRQIDNDGAESVSAIRSVFIAGNVRVSVAPNPVADVAFFKVSLEKTTHIQLQILDGLGRVVGTVADDLYTAGNFDLAFVTNGLPEGVYFYRMLGENIDNTGRFVIAK